ncbi:putative ribosomal protein S12/S23 [Helianthus debilis subsp. tardiflorus]
MYKRNGFNGYELQIKVKCLCFRKTQGMGAGRKIKSHRRRQRWANKSYRRNSILVTNGRNLLMVHLMLRALLWRKCKFIFLSYIFLLLLFFYFNNLLYYVCSLTQLLEFNLSRTGHAVGDIPVVRFKVVKVFGVSLLALLKE